MTVQELIQKLNEFPSEFKVSVKIPYYGHEDEVYDMESNGIESVAADYDYKAVKIISEII